MSESNPATVAKMIAIVREALEAETVPPVREEWASELARLEAVQASLMVQGPASALAPVAPPPPVVAPLAPLPTAASIDQTAFAVSPLTDEDALPFAPGDAAAPAPVATEEQPHEATGATSFLSADALAAAMPFEDDSASVDATGFVDAAAIGAALPFEEGAAAPPPTAATEEAPHDAVGATAFVDAAAINAALPFEDDDVPDDAGMTVEQYASFCVERVMSPGGENEVAQRYRIATEEALRTLDARFRDRFAREGELLKRYNEAYARYEAWLQSQKK